MKQEMNKYTDQDRSVWKALFNRQAVNLLDKSCEEYLDCLEKLQPVLNAQVVPDFEELNAALKENTGWEIEVVAGLIPVEDFFMLLAKKKFCSSTWLRKPEQLDYLEEPDMFHDVFGHVPLLVHPRFSDFMQKFGKMGVENAGNASVIMKLQRLYWFTIEFGLTQSKQGRSIYGAGIISSFGESNHCMGSEIEVRPFNLEAVFATEYRTDEIQSVYYELESFDQLFDAFDSYVTRLEKLATAAL
jgi:phenylalanine-4-hydroxylase